MRGRRLAALLICVMFVLLLGTACRSGEPVDVTNDAGTVNEESSSAADESEVIAGNGETENTEETERTREAENTVETETSETETSETETSETLIGSRLGTIDISGNGDILQGEEYLIINNTEEFQIFGEQTGLEKTLEWKLLAEEYLRAWHEQDALIAVSRTDDVYGYEYDAQAKLNRAGDELTLSVVRYAAEDMVGTGSVTRQLMFVAVPQADLEKVSEIRQETANQIYTQEELKQGYWTLAKGDKWLSVQEADLDHDGEDEEVALYYHRDGWVTIAVLKDGEPVWYETNILYLDGPLNTYVLFRRDGKDYLARHFAGHYSMSGYHNNYECFHLDENGREIIDHSDSIYLEDSYYDANTFPFSADEIEGYVERLNQAIENNVILLASINNEIYYAPSDVSPEVGICYVEDLGTLFTPWNGDYTGCETIAEKVEVLNRGLINRWFDNGQIPEMPETFTSLMEQLVTEKKSAMKVFTQLNTTDRSVWFEEYNGEKLQFVEPEYESTSPVDYPGKVYYCADEGETPEEVAKIMVEAMVARMMEASQGTDFVITKYRIGKQSLTDWTDIVEGLTDSCWEEYLREHRNVDEEMESYARRWIEERFQYGMYQVPLGGEMWYFYPSGYYHFEGSYLGTFEDYAETETVVDGMVPFYYQGSNPQFILVKQGDVYCMQKGTQWGIKIFEATDASVIYPEPMSVMVDGVVFKEVKEIHRADVDHDGGEELIVVQYISATDRWQVYVVKNGETIWSQGAALGVSGTRMFLYSEEGKDYLVSYSVGDGRTYRLLQFYLEPEDAENQMAVQKYKETVADYDAITIRSNGYYSYPYDGERISKYVEHVNGILSQCISLQGNEAGSAVNADGAQTGGYLEDLSEIFTPLKNYEDCQTIAEKVERLNQVKSEQWFPDGQMPEELKNLSGTLAERMAPYLGEVEERYARIDADRASWFADYNGDKLQVITKEADENRTTEIYYYRADGGETAADVAKRLVEAMYERKTVRSDASESSFVVTDYLIVDQKLKDCSIGAWDVSDAIIDDYCMNSKKRSLTDSDELNEWINLWISQRYSGDGGRTINPLPEDMWLFTPEGYCKYEGFNLATFEETLFSAYDVVDGMIPFIYQGGEGSFDYLLVKYGDVYRMQRAVDWAK